VDAIAVTHFHLDHWGDLVPWAWLNAHGPPEHHNSCALWVPPRGTDELATFASFWGNPNMIEDAFQLHEFEPEEPFEAAGIEVVAHRLPHYTLEAFGFHASEGGKTIAYSDDSAPCPELARLARGADLFVCEATLADGVVDGPPRGHPSAQEALAAADGPVLLTHRPIEFPAPDGVPLATTA
jgi:ribonuclease BN (tRNA processing enzyme)